MRSLHCISYKWAEPNFSCHAAQGVTKVLYMESYSLHKPIIYTLNRWQHILDEEFMNVCDEKAEIIENT